MRLMTDTRSFGSFFEDMDRDTSSIFAKSRKEMENKNDYGLFRRISIDIDELTKDCVFFYLFDMLSGRNRVSYVYAYIGGNAGKLLNYLKADMMGKRDCFEVGSSCKRIN